MSNNTKMDGLAFALAPANEVLNKYARKDKLSSANQTKKQ